MERPPLYPATISKELQTLYKPFNHFMDKFLDLKEELAANPLLGLNFKGNTSSGKNGIGDFRYPNGNFFRGKYEKDLRIGQGLCIYSNGSCYIGEWKNDYFHGSGAFLNRDGHIIDGVYTGTATSMYKMKHDSELRIRYASGELFDGRGKNGKRDGKGKYVYFDGSLYDGAWEHNKRHGNGMISYPDGSYAKGFWNKDVLKDCSKYVDSK